MCRRAVRVNSQLKSHKRFANAFLTYCQLVDSARLYCTNALEGPPKVHPLYLLHLPQQQEPQFCTCRISFKSTKARISVELYIYLAKCLYNKCVEYYPTCYADIIIALKLIGWKDRDRTLLVDPEEIDCLKRVCALNDNAKSIYELYKHPNPACEAGSIWKDIVLSPSRLNVQQELKYCIQRIENMK